MGGINKQDYPSCDKDLLQGPGGKVPRIDPKMLYAFKESFFGMSDDMLEGFKAIFMYEKV